MKPPLSTNPRIPFGHRLLERRHVVVAELARREHVTVSLRHKPRRVAIGQVQLVELTGEVFVVQVHPVVLGEIALDHLVIPHRREVDARVLQRECDGIIPGRLVGRSVDGNLRRTFQHDGVHVATGNLSAGTRDTRIRQRLDADAIERRAATEVGGIRQQRTRHPGS
jgi:hypothetical protein